MLRPPKALLLPLALLVAACAPSTPSAEDAGRESPGAEDAGGSAGAQPAGSGAESEVRAASLALVEAMNAHQPDSILSFYSLGEGFTYVGCTSFVFDGPTFATILQGYHPSNPDVRYDVSVQALRMLGPDMAVVALQGTSTPDVTLFTTRVLHRGEGGRWLVVWEHESWPGCAAPSGPHPGTLEERAGAVEPSGTP